jgi:hypothetical protein
MFPIISMPICLHEISVAASPSMRGGEEEERRGKEEEREEREEGEEEGRRRLGILCMPVLMLQKEVGELSHYSFMTYNTPALHTSGKLCHDLAALPGSGNKNLFLERPAGAVRLFGLCGTMCVP